MANEEMIEIDTVVVPMEDGTEQTFAVMDEFEMEGKGYVVLALLDENNDIGEEDYLFSFEEDGEDLILNSIEDDEEMERVSAYYDELCQDFEDDEEEPEE